MQTIPELTAVGNETEWLSLRQAARRLKLSWSTIIQLIYNGELQGKQLGAGHWFCASDSIDRYISNELGGCAS